MTNAEAIIEWEKLWASYVNRLIHVDAKEAELAAAVTRHPDRWNTKERQQVNFAVGKARAAARRLYDFDKAHNQTPVANYERF